MSGLFRIAALGAALLAAGCGGRSEIAFDGEVYRARATQGETRQDFTVSVRPVGAGLAGARLAAEHEGKRYCIRNYGSSRIAWAIGPETEATALPIEGNTLTLAGACDPR
jgi:hypothetical protein